MSASTSRAADGSSSSAEGATATDNTESSASAPAPTVVATVQSPSSADTGSRATAVVARAASWQAVMSSQRASSSASSAAASASALGESSAALSHDGHSSDDESVGEGGRLSGRPVVIDVKPVGGGHAGAGRAIKLGSHAQMKVPLPSNTLLSCWRDGYRRDGVHFVFCSVF